MKVYVDELPKNCVNCDFGYANNFCEIDYELDLRKFDKNQKHPKCPLQSLSEHDKQVKKQVCDEIRNKLKENGLLYTWKGEPKYKTMEELLDQIQGENNDKRRSS